MSRTAYYWDEASLRHDTGDFIEGIPRAEVLRPEALAGRVPGLDRRPARPHGAEEWVLRVHERRHLERVRQACAQGPGLVDNPDTPVGGPGSFAAALAAVDAALSAADAVAAGEADNAFCAVRPPGHHALPDYSMGFCLFATISIAARYLQERHGLRRLAIVDWDVHHGNGTQAVFWRDPDVFFASLHQYPFYPGTGAAHERGEGPGEGTILNIPLPAGTPEEVFLARFEAEVLPAVENHAPEAILISAGFDAHRSDPLGGLRMTEAGFARMTRQIKALAARRCAGRLVSLLEGGYNLGALQASAAAHLQALAE
ncbi:MAG: histone deacetylase [Candidatus Tectomicrobia bacterium]|uniref:Histone deacetylase n=1 Tax=Tectimicrobiota bacterium TaxID=2528274 RepID=A0A932HYS1_UNCTE|nr:histone deacetylase [Candidatus Tectomicrobia bacterium]